MGEGLGYAHRRTHKDVIPFEVVERISSITFVVRDMIADLDPAWRPRIVMRQCLNNDEQRWTITSDPDGLPFRIRLLRSGRWKDATGNFYTIDAEPERWHDFGLL